jgi:hypothetical protein
LGKSNEGLWSSVALGIPSTHRKISDITYVFVGVYEYDESETEVRYEVNVEYRWIETVSIPACLICLAV